MTTTTIINKTEFIAIKDADILYSYNYGGGVNGRTIKKGDVVTFINKDADSNFACLELLHKITEESFYQIFVPVREFKIDYEEKGYITSVIIKCNSEAEAMDWFFNKFSINTTAIFLKINRLTIPEKNPKFTEEYLRFNNPVSERFIKRLTAEHKEMIEGCLIVSKLFTDLGYQICYKPDMISNIERIEHFYKDDYKKVYEKYSDISNFMDELTTLEFDSHQIELAITEFFEPAEIVKELIRMNKYAIERDEIIYNMRRSRITK